MVFGMEASDGKKGSVVLPQSSPYFNPLVIMVRACCKRHPSKASLRQTLTRTWPDLGPGYIIRTCRAFRKRVEAVIAEAWLTINISLRLLETSPFIWMLSMLSFSTTIQQEQEGEVRSEQGGSIRWNTICGPSTDCVVGDMQSWTELIGKYFYALHRPLRLQS